MAQLLAILGSVVLMALIVGLVYRFAKPVLDGETGRSWAHRSDPRARCWKCGLDLERLLREGGRVRVGHVVTCPGCGAKGYARASGRVCRACGYDMLELPVVGGAIVCPECGVRRELATEQPVERVDHACRCCGYDLSRVPESAVGSVRCPECGHTRGEAARYPIRPP